MAPAASEKTLKVVLAIDISRLGHKAGDEVDLPVSYAEKLLARNAAMSLEDARKIRDAEDVKAKAEAAAEKAKKDAAAKSEAAIAAAREKADKVRKETEEKRQRDLLAKREEIRRKQAKGEKDEDAPATKAKHVGNEADSP